VAGEVSGWAQKEAGQRGRRQVTQRARVRPPPSARVRVDLQAAEPGRDSTLLVSFVANDAAASFA